MWYVMQTVSGTEAELKEQLLARIDRKICKDCIITLYEDVWRRGGVGHINMRRLFPGYVFIDTDDPGEIYKQQKKIQRFTRLLSMPGEDGEKLMDKKHIVRFPVLTGADGRRFFVVFTDNAALEKARTLEGASKLPEEFISEAVTVKLADMAKFILTPGPDGSENTTYGIVINPFMENIVIPKSLMMNIVAKRAQEARARLEKATKNMGRDIEKDGDIIRFPFGEKKNED